MKKIVTTAILCAGLVGFTGCDSFLDEEPKSEITLATYYQTEDDIVGNVNYLYRNGAPDMMGSMNGAYRGSSASVMNMVTGYFTNEYEGQEVDCQYARNLTRQNWTASRSPTTMRHGRMMIFPSRPGPSMTSSEAVCFSVPGKTGLSDSTTP